MNRPLLDNDISFSKSLSGTIFKCQLNLSFQDDAKVNALRAVNDVQCVFIRVCDGVEMADSGIDTSMIHKRNKLAIVIGEGRIYFRRHTISLADIRDAGIAAFWNFACGRIQ